MKHLFICREYPPAPSGGIGTYVSNITRLLAESGETVHIIGQLWEGALKSIEKKYKNRLTIYRIPFMDWNAKLRPKPSPLIKSQFAKNLFQADYYPLSFAWQAALLAEQIIQNENIDIIEAQEFEAPLFFLQRRLARDGKFQKHVPCIIHLHSPTEQIRYFNNWRSNISFQLANRFESYTINAADALLCPSHFLANEVKESFCLKNRKIWTIPYPVSKIPEIKREKNIWTKGSVCFVGRLERRKGVLEWIDAAVNVARDYPQIHFEFIGENILGTDKMCGAEIVHLRIPKELKKRFHFYGKKLYKDIPKYLVNARIGVVPSRWENYPYTCIEMMGSGLPLIVSPNGGMKEMVVDDRSGWVAPEMSVKGLAMALRRALTTPPEKLASMGQAAASDIRRICDEGKILDVHLHFRNEVIKQGNKPVLEPFLRGAENDFRDVEKQSHGYQLESHIPTACLYFTKMTPRKVISKIRMIIYFTLNRVIQCIRNIKKKND